jgi:hypothetical protein
VLQHWGADATEPLSACTGDLASGLVDQDELEVVLLDWDRV